MSGVPIPKLPGYSVYSPSGAGTTHAKKQTLKYLQGYAVEGEPGVALVEEKKTPDQTGFPTGQFVTATLASQGVEGPTETKLPRWVEYDRMVLRFFGYFKESVDESNMENHRIRRVVVQYYVTDGTIQVVEPKQDNSGIPQGTFLKRHRVEKKGGGFVNATDLQVDEEVELYGRVFYLVDADTFTRDFMLKEYNMDLRVSHGYPDDPYDVYRESLKPTGPPDNDVKTYVEAMLGKATNVLNEDKLKQFMDYSRKVLRFFCVWDDRERLYGDRRPYVLHYFLEDDTVEILEVNENNSGRDPFPQFLKRAPLPKGVPLVPDVTVKPKKAECYSPIDFRIGTYISVYGRPFFLHDCDDFTRFFYTESMGYDPASMDAIDVSEPVKPIPKAELPQLGSLAPWLLGSLDNNDEDAMRLVPRPTKKPFHKLMNKDKTILRFKCKLVEKPSCPLSNADKDRRFVLSHFLSNDTFAVFEPPVRNSGIIGGKFLERQKVYQPNSRVAYGESDLYVGAQLEIFNRLFELMDADEYTFQYMENNKHVYIRSDAGVAKADVVQAYTGKEEDVRSMFIEMDADGSGAVTADLLHKVFSACGAKFPKQTIVTVIRDAALKNGGSINFESFVEYLAST
mmetsp:Transcript_29457/g.83083  ORF Transcript_29457/g.83083 Transcript_29457/m.83083 type:complete len:623 (+) Transcript_29457:94-1962(+)|eukprot:CAMPEP_0117679722 /NCGR_PEP_ID=MMETSP0804-20121206/17963_1 /TAXON_ID=1074897 /ORGANISM="Tetraselmis astigmatica, Strain CCMP880" /LENGTH=622 /DNA_ID=CAMNT_0005489157 /DNA_START=41 /DNA_END=1909 /DNA_ORIENTATION=-